MGLIWSPEAQDDLQAADDFDKDRKYGSRGDKKYLRKRARELHSNIKKYLPGTSRNPNNPAMRWLPVEYGFVFVYVTDRTDTVILAVYNDHQDHPLSM